jgi:PTS system N-acetylgalactosamine-specific IIA component
MSGADAVIGVVAGHGDFAAGLLSAVEQITGRGAAFAAMTNRGKAPPDLEAELAAHLDATGARVVFTDLPAGSCTIAARRLQRARTDVVLVTGANLPLLLEFLFAAAASPEPPAARPAQLAAAAVEKARATLAASGG